MKTFPKINFFVIYLKILEKGGGKRKEGGKGLFGWSVGCRVLPIDIFYCLGAFLRRLQIGGKGKKNRDLIGKKGGEEGGKGRELVVQGDSDFLVPRSNLPCIICYTKMVRGGGREKGS